MIYLWNTLLCFALFSTISISQAQKVEIKDHQLHVNNEPQPMLFGAELQYFRLRGGYGRNVPRTKVLEIWNRALDAMVAANMNMISFYIPWDFHEYAEGKFDFTGTVDEDGDGNADYPSRDLLTFFNLIEKRGIKKIMVRPGPYINAEWGFLGFGAIPLWFHEKYPQSHMQNAQGLRTKLYDYHSPELLAATQNWFKVLHQQVLKDWMGHGKPILFFQPDNETNFMWQSLYNHDYGPRAMERYRNFLKDSYGTLESLNSRHGRKWASWGEVQAPVVPRTNLAEDQDWYRFHDHDIAVFLKLVRKYWEDLGVTEPDVMFTLAESYNATEHGLLPNFKLRNIAQATGMMTLNLYPKTYGNAKLSQHNLPFKGDHDAIAMDSASDSYLGAVQEWLLGPEIQAGWWRDTEVTLESRKQTYLGTVGHGLKALILYYFTEGDNWQSDWSKSVVEPIAHRLKKELQIDPSLPFSKMGEDFWKRLQAEVDRSVVVGIDARGAMLDNLESGKRLYFDAPLDHEANPRPHFSLVKDFGREVVGGYSKFLAKSTTMFDSVAILKDVNEHVPSELSGVDSVTMHSNWSGGILGSLLLAGANPDILHFGQSVSRNWSDFKMLIHQDSGQSSPAKIAKIREYIEKGGVFLNLVGSQVSRELGLVFNELPVVVNGQAKDARSTFKIVGVQSQLKAKSSPMYRYRGLNTSQCHTIALHSQGVLGFECKIGSGTLIQLGAVFYDRVNSDFWYDQGFSNLDGATVKSAMSFFLAKAGVAPKISVQSTEPRFVAYGRSASDEPTIWVTIKSGASQGEALKLQVHEDNFKNHSQWEIREVMAGASTTSPKVMSRQDLLKNGVRVDLDAFGSKVIVFSATR